jgi:hypothetical protein
METNITIKSTPDQQRQRKIPVESKVPSVKIDEANDKKLVSLILIRHPGKTTEELETIKEHLSRWILYKADQYKAKHSHKNASEIIADILADMEYFLSNCNDDDHYESNLIEIFDVSKKNTGSLFSNPQSISYCFSSLENNLLKASSETQRNQVSQSLKKLDSVLEARYEKTRGSEVKTIKDATSLIIQNKMNNLQSQLNNPKTVAAVLQYIKELIDTNIQDIYTNQKQYKERPIAIDKLAESNFPEIDVGISQGIAPESKVKIRIHDLYNKYQRIVGIPDLYTLSQAIKINPYAVLHGIETLINIYTMLHETGCDKAKQNSNETKSVTLFLTRDPITEELSSKEYKIHFKLLEKLRDDITALIISLSTQNYEELIKLSADFDYDHTRFLEILMVHCEIAQRQLIVHLGSNQKWFNNILKTPKGFDPENMLCHFDHQDPKKEWCKPGVLVAEMNTKFIKNLAPHLGLGSKFEVLNCKRILPLMMCNPKIHKLVTLVQNLTSPSSSMADLFEISEQFLAQAKIIAETPGLLDAITQVQNYYFALLRFFEIVKSIDNTLEKYPPSSRLVIRLPIKDLENNIEQLTKPKSQTFNREDSIAYSTAIKDWIASTTELIQNTLKVLNPKQDMGLKDLSIKGIDIKGIEYPNNYKKLITGAYERILLELQYNYLTKVIIPKKTAEYDAKYPWTTRNITFDRSKANEYNRLIAPINKYENELVTLYKAYTNPNGSTVFSMDFLNKMATIESSLAQIAI